MHCSDRDATAKSCFFLFQRQRHVRYQKSSHRLSVECRPAQVGVKNDSRRLSDNNHGPYPECSPAEPRQFNGDKPSCIMLYRMHGTAHSGTPHRKDDATNREDAAPRLRSLAHKPPTLLRGSERRYSAGLTSNPHLPAQTRKTARQCGPMDGR